MALEALGQGISEGNALSNLASVGTYIEPICDVCNVSWG